ncbi:MAG: YopT-type cysteine protease domain-containing protein [Gemmatimonadota bacterium]
MGIQAFVVRQYIKHLKSSAVKHDGFQTHDFSQSLEPTNSIIAKHGTSRDGICQAMSQRWIVMHAHGGSLFNWLCDASGKVRADAIVNLAVNQVDSETRTHRHQTDQDWASEKYLHANGIIRRTGVLPVAGQFMRDFIGGSRASGNIFQQLANGLVNSSKLVTGHYVMIGIQGPGGGHCMAAYVGHDIAFFDPNFGEYWFPDRRHFVGWFRDAVNLPYKIGDINQSFSLRTYAPRMGFMTDGFGRINNRAVGGAF